MTLSEQEDFDYLENISVGLGVRRIKDKEIYSVHNCYHCGNKTQMKQISHYERSETETFYPMFTSSIEITFYTDWDLYLCPVCDNVTLIKTSKNSDDRDPEDFSLLTEETILYPGVSIEENGFPVAVRKSFEAALRVKNIEGGLCAIAIRRTLEMMCKDKQAVGRSLYDKLSDLSNKGILPPILSDMATVLRELGNEAAHGIDDTQFSEDIIEAMIKFTQVILDYVYHLPNRISAIQEHISRTVDGVNVDNSVAAETSGERN